MVPTAPTKKHATNRLVMTNLMARHGPWVCAPMVRQSDLAFRAMVRRHGVGLAFTPMIKADHWVANSHEERSVFQTCPSDRPLVAQIAGRCVDSLMSCALDIEATGCVDAIDLNLGCPQTCAEKGRYGAYLLDEPARVFDIVR